MYVVQRYHLNRALSLFQKWRLSSDKIRVPITSKHVKSEEDCQAHNLKVPGSKPGHATFFALFFFCSFPFHSRSFFLIQPMAEYNYAGNYFFLFVLPVQNAR